MLEESEPSGLSSDKDANPVGSGPQSYDLILTLITPERPHL